MPQYTEDHFKIFSAATCHQTGEQKRYELISTATEEVQRDPTEPFRTQRSVPKIRDIRQTQTFNLNGFRKTHVYIDPSVVLKSDQIEKRDFQYRNAKGEAATPPMGLPNISFVDGFLAPTNHVMQAFLDESPYNEKNAKLCGVTPLFRELVNQNPAEVKARQAKERRQVIRTMEDYEQSHSDEEMKELLRYAITNWGVKGVQLSNIDNMTPFDVSNTLALACESHTEGMREALADMGGMRKANEIQKWLKDSLFAYTIGSQKGTKAAVVYTSRVMKVDKKLEEVILNLPTKEEFLATIQEKMGEDFEEFKTIVMKSSTPITPIQFYHHIRSNDTKELVEKIKDLNGSYGVENPHTDVTDQSKRFDSSILPALKLLEKRFKYDIK